MHDVARPLSILPGAPGFRPAPRAVFTDGRRRFVGLVARGAALLVVTFGFYRFQLTTDVRRHLWSHTSLDGDGLEYTGVARELVIGFLIALAVLTPLYLGYFLLGLELERWQAFASLPLALLLYGLGQFAIYRARRYRLTRTVWRGVRFFMTGSATRYAVKAFGWGALALVTLGAAWPWRVAALERYKLAHSFYGDRQASFVGAGGALFRKIWWMGLPVAAPLVAAAAAIALEREAALGLFSGEEVDFETLPATVRFAFLSLAPLALLPFLLPAYRAAEWRWWAAGARLGAARVACDLRAGALYKIYAKAIVVGGLVGGALAAAGVGLLYAVAASPAWGLVERVSRTGDFTALDQKLLAAGFAAAYLVTLAGIGATQRLYLQHDLWRTIAASLTFAGLETLDDVAARGEAANAFGEGLADGLDVGGL